MQNILEAAEHAGANIVYCAGETVPAGIYRELETGREVELAEPGQLPALCNGRAAHYVRRPRKWGESAGSRPR